MDKAGILSMNIPAETEQFGIKIFCHAIIRLLFLENVVTFWDQARRVGQLTRRIRVSSTMLNLLQT